uniref:Uncharacterized protein n=1 Tax=Romanomermis culicivorax TaxID=13658 RepID=A0A915K6W2_ROMCU
MMLRKFHSLNYCNPLATREKNERANCAFLDAFPPVIEERKFSLSQYANLKIDKNWNSPIDVKDG